MKKNIIIVGSGGFAKEVAFLLHQIDKYEVKGFSIDQDYVPSDKKLVGLPYLGEIDELIECIISPTNIVIAIANPAVKMSVHSRLVRNPYLKFPNLIHSSSLLGFNIKLGEGNVIMPYTTLTADITIGDFNMINIGCTIGHDVQIGAFNTLYPNNNISGNVTIKNNCELGVGTKIIPNCLLEDGIISGAGTIIIHNVEKNATVVGNPARVIKIRED